ncbi:MAG: hypothetical protein F7B59_02820 [Desulfurococcales archaeon]|nr:hypothetical protein [Desulfurococcales archaeon]
MENKTGYWRSSSIGVSEIVATVLLVLIVTAIMSTVYWAYNRDMNSQSYRINVELKRIKEENSGLDLVDYFYVESNNTLVICFYLRSNVYLVLDTAYIDNNLVNKSSVISGLNQPLTPGEVNCIRIQYPLAKGEHLVLLVSEEGARFEYTISIQ